MKHLKYIKEFFDSEEMQHKMSNDDLDMKKLVSRDSITKSTINDAIVSNIKIEIPILERFDAIEEEGNILFKEGYDFYIGSGESILAILSLHIEVSDIPETFRKGNKLEDKSYDVSYSSVIYWIEEGNEIKIFKNKYEDVSNTGSDRISPFKTCKGMKELISFLKKDITPLIEETRKEFKTRTLTDAPGKGNIPSKRLN